MNYFRLILISLAGALVVAGIFYVMQGASPVPPAPTTPATTSATTAKPTAVPPDTEPPPNLDQPLTQADQVRFYLAKSDFLKAQEIMLAVDPPTQFSSYYLGLLAAYFGDRYKAEAYLEQANKIGGSADLLQKTSKVFDAYAEFDTFKGGKPEHLRALVASAFLANGEAELALASAQTINQSNPDYKDGWKILGFAYILKENYAKAISALEKLTPTDSAEVNYYLGVAYYNLKDYTRAVSYLDFARKQTFKPDLHLKEILIESYLALGNYRTAAQLQEDLLANTSQGVQAYVKPIWIYLEVVREPSRAIPIALQAVSRYPTSSYAYALAGWAYIGNGEYDRALDYLNRAREFDSNHPAAYLNLGHLYKAKGETANAVIYYQRAYELDPDGTLGKRAKEELAALKKIAP